MSKIFCCFLAILMMFSASAQAVQLPRYLGSERKFRSYIYNPNDVYRYLGHYTYQGFIEFGDGETIATISMGNPSLWLFENLGNRLFLKPVGEDLSETNMTVITNKRVYHFELMAKEARSINDKDLIFVVKFIYPDDKDKNIVEFPKALPSDEPDMRDLSLYNFNYQYTGEPTIAPIKVFDNGEFTYFQFPKKNAEIPAIFMVDSEGFESLVNFRSAGSYIIVERVAAQFSLRNGSDIVCVYNTSLYTNGRARNDAIRNINTKPQNQMSNHVASSNELPQQEMPPMLVNPASSQTLPTAPAMAPTMPSQPVGMPAMSQAPNQAGMVAPFSGAVARPPVPSTINADPLSLSPSPVPGTGARLPGQ